MIVFLEHVSNKTITVLGAGNLGTSAIDMLYNSGHKKIIATRTKRSEEELAEIARKYEGIKTTTDNLKAANEAEILILSVKPAFVNVVAEEIKSSTQDKLLISLAAATQINELESMFRDYRIARVMTGVFAEEEIAVYTMGSKCSGKDEYAIKYIFGSRAIRVCEDVLDLMTYPACDNGIMAMETEKKIEKLSELGIEEDDARKVYGAKMVAIGKRFLEGKKGTEIFNQVTGGSEKSFTAKLYNNLVEQGHLERIMQSIEKTAKACQKK
ncbi:NAD(P)-binding domain-containing protein [Candidatus Woesearchaeota archaeon]|nr:NAD(P)-binding domain-containing protein [Candidatus Woesearchaeota archaeon]